MATEAAGSRQAIVKVFSRHDTDRDGTVSRQFLLQVLQRVSQGQAEQEMDLAALNQLLDTVDPSNSERIRYGAFGDDLRPGGAAAEGQGQCICHWDCRGEGKNWPQVDEAGDLDRGVHRPRP